MGCVLIQVEMGPKPYKTNLFLFKLVQQSEQL